MKIKLSVPQCKFCDKLYKKLHNNQNDNSIKVFTVPEPENYSLLIRKQVDAALISPLNYAEALKKADLRIIPTTCIAAVGFTGLASILINNDVRDIKTLSIQNPNSFISLISPYIFKEKYDLNFYTNKFSNESLLEQTTDAVVIEGCAASDSISLDITEEWFDLFEMPLALYFWACWADAFPNNIIEIINSIANAEEPEETILEQSTSASTNYQPREGSILWHWNDDFKSSLEATLHFLYYHRVIEDIPEIKLLE